MTGITACSTYLPRPRIPATEYEQALGRFSARIDEKAVPAFDEDAVTMAIDAGSSIPIDQEPGVLALSSTTWPQPETLASGPISRALSIPESTKTMEFGTSWKAGIEALHCALGHDNGIAIAADVPNASPDDDVEHVQGAGAVAISTGSQQSNPIAEFIGEGHHISARMPAKFRSETDRTDLQLGQYTTDGFVSATKAAIERALDSAELSLEDITHAVFPQEDVKMAWRGGLQIGFSEEQMTAGFVVNKMGFAHTAGPLLGLASALESSRPEDTLLVVGYGHGHGATALILEVTEDIETTQTGFTDQLDEGEQIDYSTYLRLRGGER
ncbi:hypothetical protein ACLI4U_12420 [Natrialbaceae archaeon A-CW2]